MGVLGVALNVVSESLKLANTKESRKYVDKLFNIKTSILNEKKRGYDSDDVRLENLYKELQIALESSEQEIKIASLRAATS